MEVWPTGCNANRNCNMLVSGFLPFWNLPTPPAPKINKQKKTRSSSSGLQDRMVKHSKSFARSLDPLPQSPGPFGYDDHWHSGRDAEVTSPIWKYRYVLRRFRVPGQSIQIDLGSKFLDCPPWRGITTRVQICLPCLAVTILVQNVPFKPKNRPG